MRRQFLPLSHAPSPSSFQTFPFLYSAPKSLPLLPLLPPPSRRPNERAGEQENSVNRVNSPNDSFINARTLVTQLRAKTVVKTALHVMMIRLAVFGGALAVLPS